MRTIASRGLRIFGSGTFSTWTFFVPCQQFALHDCTPASVSSCFGGSGRLRRTPQAGAVGDRNLSRLEQLLEAAQVVADLLFGLFAEQPGDAAAEAAGGRLVFEAHAHLGAARARRGLELDRAAVLNLRSFDRPPRDQLALAIRDDLGVPFDGRTGRRLRAPARASIPQHLHRFEVAHEPREALEVLPER